VSLLPGAKLTDIGTALHDSFTGIVLAFLRTRQRLDVRMCRLPLSKPTQFVALEELAEESGRFIRDADDLVRCLNRT
jgi:hypothetical protein